MKFLFSDSVDVVDPDYDFIADRTAVGRQRQHDDLYPHEILGRAPYDGLLVSRAILFPGGNYSPAQTMRFRRDGGRAFLRFDGPTFSNKILMGDNGAFAYAHLDTPPYTVEDTLEFYADGRFTHGCSLDHIIFDYLPGDPPSRAPTEAVRRYEITLENAEAFIKLSSGLGRSFVPLGTVQGWSPESKATAALSLEKMGYRYLAIGGMVPLRTSQIHECLKAIRHAISPEVDLHLLGFARAEQIHEFLRYRIASFDSTSPLIRAFKDSKNNYYAPKPSGGLDYYTAIRIPQATENAHLKRAIKEGRLNQEELQTKEALALQRLRAYDKGTAQLHETVDAVVDYNRFLIVDDKKTAAQNTAALASSQLATERTLRDKPWQRCSCSICRAVSIEVTIFRGSNRNKRRGIHNLSVYYDHLQATLANN